MLCQNKETCKQNQAFMAVRWEYKNFGISPESFRNFQMQKSREIKCSILHTHVFSVTSTISLLPHQLLLKYNMLNIVQGNSGRGVN